MRQSVHGPGARELYMPPKKNASSPTPIGLVWQQSIASSHDTFGFSCQYLPQFLAPRVHLLRCEYVDWENFAGL
jgi:hypothetical protein